MNSNVVDTLKRLVAHLPQGLETELKRIQHARQIRKGTFVTTEPEYVLLPQLVSANDWVVDVGANVGHYTKRLSDLVGPEGRVVAFEPVPTTFSLLAANVARFTHKNVSLINAAVSDRLDIVGFSLPKFATGLTNYYMAHVAAPEDATLRVLTIPLDSLQIGFTVSLVKIDAEGHEAQVLHSMRDLLTQHQPILIVESGSDEVIRYLVSMAYTPRKIKGSPNLLFVPNAPNDERCRVARQFGDALPQ